MYDIIYAGHSAGEYGIFVKKRPDIPSPQRDYEEIEIPGKDGKLYKDLETVSDIEIAIGFNFKGPHDLWLERFRKAKKWLLEKGQHMLELGDDPDFFYRVKKVELSDGERTCQAIGNFTATFVCEGYHYVKDGKEKMEAEKASYNPYEVSRPIYHITGEGYCILIVNGKTMNANVGQNLTIDTERMLAYREDGTLQNTQVTGDYEDLYLQPGENTITITSGFDLKIIPNWRCL